MAGSQNTVIVNIMGTEYPIKSDADPDYTRKVAQYVDTKMREMAEISSLKSVTKLAVLTAMNIADELFRERERKESLESKLNERALKLASSLSEAMDGR